MSQHRTRGVAYFRMSSDMQDRSIDQQREWAQSACEREDIALLAEFQDAAKSGTEASRRTDFNNMLRFCQAQGKARQPVDCLVLWNTNRFSRADSIETNWYIHEFRKAGVERILTSSGWIDFGNPQHRVLFGISQDLTNHQYSRDLAQSSLRGRIANAIEGRWNGGPAPFGYLVEYEWVAVKGRRRRRPVKLVRDPEKAPTLVWIFESYATGLYSTWQLAQELNRRAVAPPGRAKLWNPTTLSVILHNELYTGDSDWGRRRTGKFFCAVDCTAVPREGRHGREEKAPAEGRVRKAGHNDQLVTPQLFAAVQRRLVERQKRTTPRHEHDFRLTGLLRCGHCGARMVGRHKPLRGKDAAGRAVRLFLCGGYARHGLQACHHNAVYEEPLFKALGRKLQEQLLNEDTLDRLETFLHEEATADPGAAVREQAGRRAAELERLVADAAGRLVRETHPAVQAACREEIIRLSAERDQLQAVAQADTVPPGPDPAEAIADARALMRRLDAALKAADAPQARAVLADLVDRVELFFDHQQGSRGIACAYARGLVFLKESTPLASLLHTTNSHVGQVCNSAFVITAADLEAAA